MADKCIFVVRMRWFFLIRYDSYLATLRLPNFCANEIIFEIHKISLTDLNCWHRNLNELSLEYQSYSKSIKIDTFKQKCVYNRPLIIIILTYAFMFSFRCWCNCFIFYNKINVKKLKYRKINKIYLYLIPIK